MVFPPCLVIHLPHGHRFARLTQSARKPSDPHRKKRRRVERFSRKLRLCEVKGMGPSPTNPLRFTVNAPHENMGRKSNAMKYNRLPLLASLLIPLASPAEEGLLQPPSDANDYVRVWSETIGVENVISCGQGAPTWQQSGFLHHHDQRPRRVQGTGAP